jgi:uncharacterized membrane protein
MLKFLHLLGAILIGGGLIGVWVADLRSRRLRRLPAFAESVRNIAVFYDGLVVPGAILLLISGAWLIVEFFDGWEFVKVPWLAGMVFLFAFEFVEGNTVTRSYFTRLRRLTNEALKTEKSTPELERARGERVPTFTHFLDLPILVLIVALGSIRPTTWLPFTIGAVLALTIAGFLTACIPRLYPWGAEEGAAVR